MCGWVCTLQMLWGVNMCLLFNNIIQLRSKSLSIPEDDRLISSLHSNEWHNQLI